MADGEGHGQDRQTEGEWNTEEANSKVWNSGGQNRAAAIAKYQPECADKFCTQFLHALLMFLFAFKP